MRQFANFACRALAANWCSKNSYTPDSQVEKFEGLPLPGGVSPLKMFSSGRTPILQMLICGLGVRWQTTHPVLVIVDDWNECFPVSRRT